MKKDKGLVNEKGVIFQRAQEMTVINPKDKDPFKSLLVHMLNMGDSTRFNWQYNYTYNAVDLILKRNPELLFNIFMAQYKGAFTKCQQMLIKTNIQKFLIAKGI